MKVSHKPVLFASLSSFFLAFALTGAAWAQNNNSRPARPGSINYVEGQASIGGQALDIKSVGSAELQAGQTLTTQTGKVEILLTPGVFLRVGDNSAVKIISPDLANTEVQLDKGEAMVEVSNITKNNNIRVDETVRTPNSSPRVCTSSTPTTMPSASSRVRRKCTSTIRTSNSATPASSPSSPASN